MEDNSSELYNMICYLQGYLDCLFNLEADFDGSLVLFLSPTGLIEFVDEALNLDVNEDDEQSKATFFIQGEILKKPYSYDLINDLLHQELIIKPFNTSDFNNEIKGYVLYKFMDVLREIVFGYLDENKLMEYCYGLQENSYRSETEISQYDFNMTIFSLPLKENQFLIMSLAKRIIEDNKT